MDVDQKLSLDWEIIDVVDKLSSMKLLKEDTERELMGLLWKSRPRMTVRSMCGLTGWSKQTIYTKWHKYGFNIME